MRKLKHFLIIGVALLPLMAGCAARDKVIRDCQNENTKMRLELNRKNERLKKFNQLDKNDQLKGDM